MKRQIQPQPHQNPNIKLPFESYSHPHSKPQPHRNPNIELPFQPYSHSHYEPPQLV
jgi:hypothetical protein